MNAKEAEMEYVTGNLYLASYLRLRGVEPEFRKVGKDVVFVFDADSVKEAEGEYWRGEEVNSVKYADKIKETKSTMYYNKFEKKD